jgi:hypothetical protein
MNRINIRDHADQQFGTIIGGRRVTMRIRKNPTTDRCTLDLSIDDQPVLHGRKIVTGVDLLAAFDFGLGVIFAASVLSGTEPTLDALVGGSVRVFSATDAEVEAV